MVVCKGSVFTIIILYMILSKILLFVAIRYLGEDMLKMFGAIAIFDFIYLLDLIPLLALFGGMCT